MMHSRRHIRARGRQRVILNDEISLQSNNIPREAMLTLQILCRDKTYFLDVSMKVSFYLNLFNFICFLFQAGTLLERMPRVPSTREILRFYKKVPLVGLVLYSGTRGKDGPCLLVVYFEPCPILTVPPCIFHLIPIQKIWN